MPKLLLVLLITIMLIIIINHYTVKKDNIDEIDSKDVENNNEPSLQCNENTSTVTSILISISNHFYEK